MKNLFILLFSLLICLPFQKVNSQDTFSIVAVDSITGEVGSAGASCVNLFNTSFSYDSFLGVLFPGKGAINCQAYYLPANQNNATARMNAGDTPQEIIDWLVANDVQGNPAIRQYGVVAMVNGSPQSAAYTGVNTDNYKGHVTGPNYSIQGNILSGKPVLDSMEARFLRAEGDLACKLMAALQGANMVGADARCSSNGTSSLFAFVKVSQQDDAFGDPSFLMSVRTRGGAGIEPIDSLQVNFDAARSCNMTGIETIETFDEHFNLYPNPIVDNLSIISKGTIAHHLELQVLNMAGERIFTTQFSNAIEIKTSHWSKGIYLLKIEKEGVIFSRKIIKL